MGRLPRRGGRRATARSASSPATATTPRPTSRACSRRRPGSTPRRRSSTARSSPSTSAAAPTSACSRSGSASCRDGPAGAARVPGVRPALPRRPLAARRPARAAQEAARARGPARRPGSSYAQPHRHRGRRVLRRGQGPAASRGSSPSTGASRYEPGRRSPAWLKIKARPEQELVVGGWTPGEGSAKELGAVVVGVYEGERLRFAGKVGSGFDGRTRKVLRERLDALETDAPPFDPPPPPGLPAAAGAATSPGVRWIRPELVIRAEIGGWTRDGHVRQTAFKGLELGRDPREVVKEQAVDPAARGARGGGHVARRAGRARDTGPGGSERWRTRRREGEAPKAKATRAKATEAAKPDPHRGVVVPTARARRARRAQGDEGTWIVGGQDLKLTNLDKVAVPAARRRRRAARDQARADRLLRPDRAGDAARTSWTGRSTSSGFPNGAGAPGFWQKDIPSSAPKWLTIWHETGFREREDRAGERPPDRGPGGDAVLAGQPGRRSRSTPGPRRSDEPWTPTFALIDIDPGTKTTWDETLDDRPPLPDRARAPRRARLPQDRPGSRGIQAWIPIERGRYSYERHERLGREAVAGGRRDRARPRVVGVGEGRPGRQGAPRLHPERGRSRRSSRRTPSGRATARRSPPRSAGRSWTTRPRAGPLDDPEPPGAGRRDGRPVRRGPDRPPGAAGPVARAAPGRPCAIGARRRRWTGERPRPVPHDAATADASCRGPPRARRRDRWACSRSSPPPRSSSSRSPQPGCVAPFVGNSLTVYTSIIGIILAGIALGAWAGGRVSDRVPPATLLGPTFVARRRWRRSRRADRRAARARSSPAPGGDGELPGLAVAFIAARGDPRRGRRRCSSGRRSRDVASSGSLVGRLSAIGTAGALVGTFLTGYVLLGVVPVRTLIVGTGVVLVVAGRGAPAAARPARPARGRRGPRPRRRSRSARHRRPSPTRASARARTTASPSGPTATPRPAGRSCSTTSATPTSTSPTRRRSSSPTSSGSRPRPRT